ncbi:MAG: FAD-dependent oxidoreductase, partial [Actinomycetota bacterium]|nr:FAD-dependent oxidoreductase [Actinomycetota bacterium]
MNRTFVIVGAGLAGAAAAQELRAKGFDGRVVLIGTEDDPPYERPPLSKEYLRGERDDPAFVRPREWYAENDIDLRTGSTVTSVDASGPGVELDGGERIDAAAVLLATGGSPRRLPGGPSDRVLYLRELGDADRIKEALSGGRLVVIGAGFIGAEVAASARSKGVEVTVLEMAPVPLARALGEDVGAIYGRIHRDEGIDLRTEEGVETIEETSGGVAVRTTKGDTVEAAAVVVGVGIAPNIGLAEGAGLATSNGVDVDASCRTSASAVFAAGDIANHNHPLFGRIRVEHFDNALKMGTHVARSMMGESEPFTDPHWFWSDQYDVNLQYAGFATKWDDVVVRGSLEDRNGTAFYLNEGVVLAALGLNRGKDVRRAMKLISARARPDPASLADDQVDLRTLVP